DGGCISVPSDCGIPFAIETSLSEELIVQTNSSANSSSRILASSSNENGFLNSNPISDVISRMYGEGAYVLYNRWSPYVYILKWANQHKMKIVADIKAQTVPAILIVVGAAMAMSGAGMNNLWLAQVGEGCIIFGIIIEIMYILASLK
ncbi:MAG: hypothetical protein ACFFER_17710, partial [Candidatus Thorarchaeota archaeon]